MARGRARRDNGQRLWAALEICALDLSRRLFENAAVTDNLWRCTSLVCVSFFVVVHTPAAVESSARLQPFYCGDIQSFKNGIIVTRLSSD